MNSSSQGSNQNDKDQFPKEDEILDTETTWSDVFYVLKRRRKIIIVAALSVFMGFTAFTLYKRLFSPVYKGTFSILIKDPIGDSSGEVGGKLADIGAFNAFTKGISDTETDTLIEYLKSPLILGPINTKYGINYRKFYKKLEISNINSSISSCFIFRVDIRYF